MTRVIMTCSVQESLPSPVADILVLALEQLPLVADQAGRLLSCPATSWSPQHPALQHVHRPRPLHLLPRTPAVPLQHKRVEVDLQARRLLGSPTCNRRLKISTETKERLAAVERCRRRWPVLVLVLNLLLLNLILPGLVPHPHLHSLHHPILLEVLRLRGEGGL